MSLSAKAGVPRCFLRSVFMNDMAFFCIAAVIIVAAAAALWIFSKKCVRFDPNSKKTGSPDLSSYVLLFEDDFDGTALNTEIWSCEGKTSPRRGGYWDPACVHVKDSDLVIDIVYKENGDLGSGWYTGAVRSEPNGKNRGFQQKYGYFECRCRVPNIKGAWAAFWLMPQGNFENCDINSGKDGSEVDIFESMYAFSPFYPIKNSVTHAVHIGGYGNGLKSIGSPNFFFKDLYTGYHTYGVLWDATGYTFYIDGKESWHTKETRFQGKKYSNVSHTPEYMLLSCEVAGSDRNGNVIPGREYNKKGKLVRCWNGNPNQNSKAQTYSFCVDYVRVYGKRGGCTPAENETAETAE